MSFEPTFTITKPMLNDLMDIVKVKGFLEAAVLSDEWISDMQDKALILEAYHTTHIEGTQLTLEQSEQLLKGEEVKNTNPDDVKELINYREAFDLVAGYLDSGKPITEGLVREIHKTLVEGVRGNSAAPGEYRKIQNYVVNSKTGETVYTPPPAYEIQLMMQELVDYLNQFDDVHPVLLSGIAQFQLVHIHPFLDGNGRTARLLSTLCLYRSGYDFKRLFTISEYYDQNRIDYYEALQNVRKNNMDLTGWLEYFTHGLSEQMHEIKQVGESVIRADVIVKKYNLSQKQNLALRHIIQYGELTIKDFEQLSQGTPRRSLQRELKGLVDLSLIQTKGSTNRLTYHLVT